MALRRNRKTTFNNMAIDREGIHPAKSKAVVPH